MENTEAEVVHRPDLTLSKILVTAQIPVREGHPGHATAAGWTNDRKVTFTIDLDTWECTGEVSGQALVDEDWWKQQCKRVSDRVRTGTGIENLLV